MICKQQILFSLRIGQRHNAIDNTYGRLTRTHLYIDEICILTRTNSSFSSHLLVSENNYSIPCLLFEESNRNYSIDKDFDILHDVLWIQKYARNDTRKFSFQTHRPISAKNFKRTIVNRSNESENAVYKSSVISMC